MRIGWMCHNGTMVTCSITLHLRFEFVSLVIVIWSIQVDTREFSVLMVALHRRIAFCQSTKPFGSISAAQFCSLFWISICFSSTLVGYSVYTYGGCINATIIVRLQPSIKYILKHRANELTPDRICGIVRHECTNHPNPIDFTIKLDREPLLKVNTIDAVTILLKRSFSPQFVFL